MPGLRDVGPQGHRACDHRLVMLPATRALVESVMHHYLQVYGADAAQSIMTEAIRRVGSVSPEGAHASVWLDTLLDIAVERYPDGRMRWTEATLYLRDDLATQ